MKILLLFLMPSLLLAESTEIRRLTVRGIHETAPVFMIIDSSSSGVDVWREVVKRTCRYPSTAVYHELTVRDSADYILKRVKHTGPSKQYPEERIETFLDSGVVTFTGQDTVSLQSTH